MPRQDEGYDASPDYGGPDPSRIEICIAIIVVAGLPLFVIGAFAYRIGLYMGWF